MGDISTTAGWGGGYADLWRSEPSRRARVTLLVIVLTLAVLFVGLFASEIGLQNEWNRARFLCVCGVVVNVAWIGSAALRMRRSLRPLMLYICSGFILNCVLIAFAVGLPYY